MNTKLDIDSEVMIVLWEFMEGLFGSSFTSQYGKQAKTWLKHFQRKKFTPAHIELGKKKCEELGETHSPNLSTFSRYCTPEFNDYRLPDEDEAYLMATRGDWRIAIVWHAVTKVGQWEFRTWPENKSRKAFEKHYRNLFRLYVAGERFVIPVCDVPQIKGPEPTAEEVAAARIVLSRFVGREDAFKPKA